MRVRIIDRRTARARGPMRTLLAASSVSLSSRFSQTSSGVTASSAGRTAARNPATSACASASMSRALRALKAARAASILPGAIISRYLTSFTTASSSGAKSSASANSSAASAYLTQQLSRAQLARVIASHRAYAKCVAGFDALAAAHLSFCGIVARRFASGQSAASLAASVGA